MFGGGIESLLDLRDRNSNSRLILFLFLLILRKRTPKRPKTPIWCSIVDAFQTSATEARNDFRLDYLADAFALNGNYLM